eukprot:753154-Hanusia_phi.AAC.2
MPQCRTSLRRKNFPATRGTGISLSKIWLSAYNSSHLDARELYQHGFMYEMITVPPNWSNGIDGGT